MLTISRGIQQRPRFIAIGAAVTSVFIVTAGPPASAGEPCVPEWDNAIGTPGMNAPVDGLVAHEGDLYAAGEFSIAGGQTVNRIARWDGNAWHPLGTGLNGAVRDVTTYQGDIIAAGGFTTAGGIDAQRVARWDGNTWHPMGDIVGWAMQSLAVYQGDLYMGGEIITADGHDVNDITRWDGKTGGWHPVGGGMFSPPDNGQHSRVFALTVFDGYLIAGGQFMYAGDELVDGIARWDGESWQPIGDGLNRGVRALVEYNGQLVAGGEFNTADGAPGNYIARWEGPSLDEGSWEPIGEGMDNWVRKLTVHDGALIAGGSFTLADGKKANYIAKWDEDAGTWTALEEGVSHTSHPNPAVRALGVYDGDLIVGGNFDTAGTLSSSRIAAWTGCPDDTIPGDLNGDGSVGVPDLLILINSWGECADCDECPADLNGDCTVGVPDLLILINNWG